MHLLTFDIENMFIVCLPLALLGIAVKTELELEWQYSGTQHQPAFL